MKGIRGHLSYANVAATLALVLALSGVGYGAIRIGPKQLKPDAVRGYHIKNGHVGGNNLGLLQEVIRVSDTRSHVYAGVLFVNCGSVGKPKDGDPRGGFAVLEPAGTAVVARVERFEYDAEYVAGEVAAAGLPAEYGDKLLQAV